MAISNVSSGLRPGVCTSTTRPQAPFEGQMIYETDTDLVRVWSGSAWVEVSSMLTKAPRGVMAFRNRTANTGVIAASVDTVTITAISFIAEANRYYRITYYEPQMIFGAGHTYTDMAIRNGTTAAGTLLALGAPNGTSTVRNSDSVIAVATFSAGTVNVVATLSPNGGTVNGSAGATFPAFLLVEDIGAV